jgi:hypothetical protein
MRGLRERRIDAAASPSVQSSAILPGRAAWIAGASGAMAPAMSGALGSSS